MSREDRHQTHLYRVIKNLCEEPTFVSNEVCKLQLQVMV